MGIWDWKDRKVERAVFNVLKGNLCLSSDDKVLIVSDEDKERIGELLFFYATLITPKVVHITYPRTGRHGIEPPEKVWKAAFGEELVRELKEKGLMERILKKELSQQDELEIKELLLEETSPEELPTVIVAVNTYSVSHTLFRKLSNFLSVRFASMPLFEPFMFYTSLQANYAKVAKLSKKIANLLTEAVRANLKCPLGTDITFDLTGREGLADTGKLCSPGDFGNLPAGEAFIAPVESKTEGVFITKYSPERELKEPIKLYVEKGKVVEVKGEDPFADYLRNIIKREENAGNIAELGIGTNEKAKVKTNILEAEKILGTCHVALGDNSSFGGKVKANFHLDLLIEKPTLTLTLPNGKEVKVIEEGKVLI